MNTYIITTTLESTSSLIDRYIYKVGDDFETLQFKTSKKMEGTSRLRTNKKKFVLAWIIATQVNAKIKATTVIKKEGDSSYKKEIKYPETVSDSAGIAKRKKSITL